MNSEVCQLKELVRFYDRSSITLLLNTWLLEGSGTFRDTQSSAMHTAYNYVPPALVLVRPKDVDLQLFDITYVQCGDVELENKIDEKIDQFIYWLEKHPNKKSQICLSFYEVKNNKAIWFSNKVERLYWEHWYINLNVVQCSKAQSSKSHRSKVVVPEVLKSENASEEDSARRHTLEASPHDVLFQIVRFVNEKKDHIPPIPSRESISFPFDITILGRQRFKPQCLKFLPLHLIEAEYFWGYCRDGWVRPEGRG
ncbi:hypothetical protein Nepgr_016605 [Nepenthes gracilis]|uniref:Autophagy-related protein 101 n=1 Tax=Nepenthes gracilis TaxID=150966 RepID=A0AAD3SQ08_NEPGR|nr:hypothetical protein Nepgr_016605 [Nepenthes gracilis]